MVSELLFNMVLEPNFVLGIKQTSLATKKILTRTSPSKVTHACLLDLDFTASRSRHGSLLCPDPQAQAICCLSLSNLCTTSLRLRKPIRQTCSMAYRDQNPGTRPPMAAARATTHGQRLLELSHAPPQILDSQLRSQSHAPLRRPCHPPIYLA